MRKQELIDTAEASGLSRAPIAYVINCLQSLLLILIKFGYAVVVLKLGSNVVRSEKGKGKPGKFGSSPRDWYSGWSCMKTLITKGLVVKSSCPAKYACLHFFVNVNLVLDPIKCFSEFVYKDK